MSNKHLLLRPLLLLLPPFLPVPRRLRLLRVCLYMCTCLLVCKVGEVRRRIQDATKGAADVVEVEMP